MEDPRWQVVLNLTGTLVSLSGSYLNPRVVKRPFLDDFVEGLHRLKVTRLVVWDDHVFDDVDTIMRSVPALDLEWDRVITRRGREELNKKDIRHLYTDGYGPHNTIVVESSPMSVIQYGNTILVSPYDGRAYEEELANVLTFLECDVITRLRETGDVRHPACTGYMRNPYEKCIPSLE